MSISEIRALLHDEQAEPHQELLQGAHVDRAPPADATEGARR